MAEQETSVLSAARRIQLQIILRSVLSDQRNSVESIDSKRMICMTVGVLAERAQFCFDAGYSARDYELKHMQELLLEWGNHKSVCESVCMSDVSITCDCGWDKIKESLQPYY